MAYTTSYFLDAISPHVRLTHIETNTVRKFIKGLFYPSTPIFVSSKPNQIVVTFGVNFHQRDYKQNAFLTGFAETIISRWMSTRVKVFVFKVAEHQAKPWYSLPKRI